MTTAYVRHVDPDSAGNGNGSENVLSGPTCAFSSVVAVIAAIGTAGQPTSGGFVANDESLEIICHSGHANHTADANACNFPAIITSATCFVKVVADASSYAGTAWSTSKFRLSLSTTSAFVVNASVIIEGIQAEGTSTSQNRIPFSINFTTTASVLLKNCFGRNAYNNNFSRSIVFAIYGADGPVNFVNCVGISYSTRSNGGALDGCFMFSTTTQQVTAVGCIAIGSTYGFNNNSCSTAVLVKNCYAGGGGSSRFVAQSGYTLTQTTCSASDTTAYDASLDSKAVDTNNFTNVTTSTFDCALPSASSALVNVGTDLSGESAPLNYAYDILGNARGATWDIGPHEYGAGGAPPATPAAWIPAVTQGGPI